MYFADPYIKHDMRYVTNILAYSLHELSVLFVLFSYQSNVTVTVRGVWL